MSEDLVLTIKNILQDNHFGIFTTVRWDSPHSTLVCFGQSEDLSEIFFFTPKNSRKMINSMIYNNVCFFIDTAQNRPEDIKTAYTIAAYGTALRGAEMTSGDFEKYKTAYLKKNPHMDFFLGSGVDLVKITVQKYEIVNNFQTVIQVIDPEGDKEISVRQSRGDSIYEGVHRGPVVIVGALKDLESVREESVVYLTNMDPELLSALKSSNFSALIAKDIAPEFESELKKMEIPSIKHVSPLPDDIATGDQVTVDSYLGITIYHAVI